MMKVRGWLKLCLTLAFAGGALWLLSSRTCVKAFAGGPDPGRTGAPGELTCATGECHGTLRLTEAERFRLAVPREYWPGQTYQIEIQHFSSDPTRLRWGFQLTALTRAQQRAGEWRSRDTFTQVVEDRVPGSTRQYIQHTRAGTFAGQSGSARWIVDWTAPPTDEGPVTFYATGNQADNNNNSSGDQIYLTQAVSVRGTETPPPAPTAPATQSGSLLVFPLFSSSATNPRAHNTRLSLTNQHATHNVTIHLYFVDGSAGAAQQAVLQLGPQQTSSLLASDYDPGLTGYLLALAVNENTACPTQFNELLGEASIKLGNGFAANLQAESFFLHTAFACGSGATQVDLRFDGRQYSQAPRVTALSSTAGSGETLLALLRWGGALGTPLQTGSGVLYDAQTRPLGFTFSHPQPQLLRVLANGFPNTTPAFPALLPTGSSGWLKLWLDTEAALLGAVLQTAGNAPGAAQGRRLHTLTLANSVTLTVPLLPR